MIDPRLDEALDAVAEATAAEHMALSRLTYAAGDAGTTEEHYQAALEDYLTAVTAKWTVRRRYRLQMRALGTWTNPINLPTCIADHDA